jgi:hypothetical protein
MKYYYIAPDSQLKNILESGIKADADKIIKIVTFRDDFVVLKYVFDIFAYEILHHDYYILFKIVEKGIQMPLLDSISKSKLAVFFKSISQPAIDRKYIELIPSDDNFQSMGLENGIFPVEHKEKFTDRYKQKILDYLQGLNY